LCHENGDADPLLELRQMETSKGGKETKKIVPHLFNFKGMKDRKEATAQAAAPAGVITCEAGEAQMFEKKKKSGKSHKTDRGAV